MRLKIQKKYSREKHATPAAEHMVVQEKRDEIRKHYSRLSRRVVAMRLALDAIDDDNILGSSAEANKFLRQNMPAWGARTISGFRASRTTPFSQKFALEYSELLDDELRDLAHRLIAASGAVLEEWRKLSDTRSKLADTRIFMGRRFPWKKLDKIKALHAEQRLAWARARHSMS